MIQDIDPHKLDMGFKSRDPQAEDYVISLDKDKVLLANGKDGQTVPTCAQLEAAHAEIGDSLVYLFGLDDRAVFLAAKPVTLPEGFCYEDITVFRTLQPSWLAFAGVTASHLADWFGKNRFCGVCGGVMAPKRDERALLCGSCGNTVYPRISPAVIVAVINGDKIVLTRYANRASTRPALVAGFMEVGETFEDTVRREVMEEVGLRVKNLRYYQSQPWAFSGSILVGFFADLDGSPEITLDTNELKEGLWVNREDVPPIESRVALTAEMMEMFRLGKEPKGSG